MRKNLGYILERAQKIAHKMSPNATVQGLRLLETELNCVCQSRNHSRNELLNVSRKDIDQIK